MLIFPHLLDFADLGLAKPYRREVGDLVPFAGCPYRQRTSSRRRQRRQEKNKSNVSKKCCAFFHPRCPQNRDAQFDYFVFQAKYWLDCSSQFRNAINPRWLRSVRSTQSLRNGLQFIFSPRLSQNLAFQTVCRANGTSLAAPDEESALVCKWVNNAAQRRWKKSTTVNIRGLCSANQSSNARKRLPDSRGQAYLLSRGDPGNFK